MSPHIVRKKRRASTNEVMQRMHDAVRHPRILEMGMVEIMEVFSLNHQRAATVKNDAISKKIKSGKAEDLLSALNNRSTIRLRARVLRTEKKYPRIHRQLLAERFQSTVAGHYGITRERARQIKNQFHTLVTSARLDSKSALDEVEHSATK